MKPRVKVLFFFIAIIVIISYLLFPRTNSFSKQSAFLMDSPVTIKVQGASPQVALTEIRRLDKLFNKYSSDSEISKLNRGEKISLSADTIQCLALAETIKKQTNGVFDVRFAGVIDLGGIAKGCAVEKARQALLQSGAKSGIIDMRSSIAVFGNRSPSMGLGASWKIGIQHPRKKNKLLGVVELKNGQALSTSGDYERGKHIVNPKTHQAAEGCESVTLVGTNAAQLDALSTAVFVVGAKQGFDLVHKFPGVSAVIVDSKGKIFSDYPGFKLR